MRTLLALVALAPSIAVADVGPAVQADLGLSVITVGYEHPVADHITVALGAGILGTYFLPWFDAGDNTRGAVGNLRVTWFRNDTGRGLYVTPYLRAGAVTLAEGDDGRGLALTTGVFVGYAIGLTEKLDLRLGAGAQYIYLDTPGDTGASTPFAALDIALGYRL